MLRRALQAALARVRVARLRRTPAVLAQLDRELYGPLGEMGHSEDRASFADWGHYDPDA